MFRVIDENGCIYVADPKREAYKYLAMLQGQGRLTELASWPDKMVVSSPGLMTLIFCKEK